MSVGERESKRVDSKAEDIHTSYVWVESSARCEAVSVFGAGEREGPVARLYNTVAGESERERGNLERPSHLI
jgi:hypothetical protein